MAYPALPTFITGGRRVGVGVSPGSSVKRAPRVNRAQFGDGYAQRSGDGLNADLREFQVKWTSLTFAERKALDDFLTSRQGYLPFTFQIPGEAAPRQWECAQWSLDLQSRGNSDVSATFKENCDP